MSILPTVHNMHTNSHPPYTPPNPQPNPGTGTTACRAADLCSVLINTTSSTSSPAPLGWCIDTEALLKAPRCTLPTPSHHTTHTHTHTRGMPLSCGPHALCMQAVLPSNHILFDIHYTTPSDRAAVAAIDPTHPVAGGLWGSSLAGRLEEEQRRRAGGMFTHSIGGAGGGGGVGFVGGASPEWAIAWPPPPPKSPSTVSSLSSASSTYGSMVGMMAHAAAEMGTAGGGGWNSRFENSRFGGFGGMDMSYDHMGGGVGMGGGGVRGWVGGGVGGVQSNSRGGVMVGGNGAGGAAAGGAGAAGGGVYAYAEGRGLGRVGRNVYDGRDDVYDDGGGYGGGATHGGGHDIQQHTQEHMRTNGEEEEEDDRLDDAIPTNTMTTTTTTDDDDDATGGMSGATHTGKTITSTTTTNNNTTTKSNHMRVLHDTTHTLQQQQHARGLRARITKPLQLHGGFGGTHSNTHGTWGSDDDDDEDAGYATERGGWGTWGTYKPTAEDHPEWSRLSQSLTSLDTDIDSPLHTTHTRTLPRRAGATTMGGKGGAQGALAPPTWQQVVAQQRARQLEALRKALQGQRQRTVYVAATPGGLVRAVTVDEWEPRGPGMPEGMPSALLWLVSLVRSVSLALAMLNALPCKGMDGYAMLCAAMGVGGRGGGELEHAHGGGKKEEGRRRVVRGVGWGCMTMVVLVVVVHGVRLLRVYVHVMMTNV